MSSVRIVDFVSNEILVGVKEKLAAIIVCIIQSKSKCLT